MLWSNNLRDIGERAWPVSRTVCAVDSHQLSQTNFLDKIEDFFFTSCHKAGPEDCPMYMKTPAEIRARYQTIIDRIRHSPLSVYRNINDTTTYGLLDYTAIRGIFFKAFFKPRTRFKPFAQALVELENGDGWNMFGIADDKSNRIECPSCDKQKGRRAWEEGDEASTAIRCSEGDVVEDDVEELTRRYEVMASQFSSYADIWVWSRVRCVGWKVQAKLRYAGELTLCWEGYATALIINI